MGPPVGGDIFPFIRHRSNCTTEAGFVKQAKEGEPLYDGAVLLEPRGQEPGAFNVVSTYKAQKSGPAQVATNEYREGYDRIFGGSQPVGQA